MNTLQRRMFAQGDSASSLSPSILEYASKLGIDPTGKNAGQLTDEINLTLEAQEVYLELTWLERKACFLILPIL